MKTKAGAKVMMLAALAASAIPLFGGSYSYSGMTWYDTVSPGKWTSKFSAAKEVARKSNIPLIVVWANPPCGYCKTFESSVGGSSAVKTWMLKRKYMFVFALGTANNANYGLSGGDGSAAQSFAGSGLSGFPFVGVWWPKDKGGKEVKQTFTGRNGYMPITSGTLANQFMDSVDQLVGAYAGIEPKYLKVTFSANGGSVSPGTRLVENGKAVGTLPTPTRSGYFFSGWFTAKTGGTKISSTTKVSGNVTYYAQWLKGVKLTLSASPSAGGTVTGTGTYKERDTVTVKASAKSGYVFSCWKQGKTMLSQSATYKYALGSSAVTLTACFVSKTQDRSSISLKVNGSAQDATKVVTNTVPQGVKLEWPIDASADTAATPSVSGLPSGLRLVKAQDGTYSVSGVPTAASSVNSKTKLPKPSVATFKVKTAAGNTVPYKMAIVVAPRPDWAVGTFNGCVLDDKKNPAGLVQSLTVAANGKVSGKILSDGLTWTLNAASLDSVDVLDKLGNTAFRATVTAKSGKQVATNEISIAATGVTAPKWKAWQNLWKVEPWKNIAKPFARAKALPFGEVLLKFASSGAVTAKGTFVVGYNDKAKRDVTYSASCSSVLIPLDASQYFLYLYFPKKDGKFDGYAAEVSLVWNAADKVFSVVE